jgi:3-hydroxyisobutyrate dehydrogenase|tara:strand:+ start:1423 stop:2301 length:879 start_codon:yes stop_codon:yes gene_type:complete
MAKVSFIGLGVMGFPMAGHLSNSGHEVRVYNRTAKKSEEWKSQFKGTTCKSPREAAFGADFVMACVGNDDDLREICLGEDGAFKGMGPGTIFVDHTTVSAKITRELANISKKAGIGFIDAPVSGGQAGAINGQLGVMCGGNPDTYVKAEKIISSYAKVCKLLGPSGAGQLTKMVNQICIAGLVQGLSEGLNFADKAGLDIKEVVDVISAGAAGSWQMVNRHETMSANKFEHGFAVDWMRKDLGICLATGEENGASLPVTALVDQFYKEVQNLGGGRWDTSSLIVRLRELKNK